MATEREGLGLRVASTIEFHFGTLCDYVRTFVDQGIIPAQTGEAIKRRIRTEGNQAIRVIDNHLTFFNISRNTQAEALNTERVIRHATETEG